MLDELISDSPESALERATLPAGIEEKLSKVDWNKQEVLIGYVNGTEQMKRCINGKFYYTYKSKISREHLPIHYIALYQKNTGIEYYGRVLTTQIIHRKDLPGKGRNPQELCYKFDIEDWVALPSAILPEAYGPNPISYTNHFLLTHSTKYPELHLRSGAEYRFFTELKRRTQNVSINEDETNIGFELNDIKVLFDNSIIQIIKNGKILGNCSIQEFSQRPSLTFRRLQKKYLF